MSQYLCRRHKGKKGPGFKWKILANVRNCRARGNEILWWAKSSTNMVLELICASILIAVLFMVSKKNKCCDEFFFVKKNSCVFSRAPPLPSPRRSPRRRTRSRKVPPKKANSLLALKYLKNIVSLSRCERQLYNLPAVSQELHQGPPTPPTPTPCSFPDFRWGIGGVSGKPSSSQLPKVIEPHVRDENVPVSTKWYVHLAFLNFTIYVLGVARHWDQHSSHFTHSITLYSQHDKT